MKKVLALVALAAVTLMAATAAPLAVGSKAPALAANKWIKGEAVRKFEPGTVYVVEFWATWCPPCIKAIPHLTQLQKKHGDKVVVIGVAGSERPPRNGPDRRYDAVKTFVGKQGNQMDYRVVFDGTSATYNAWMKAAGKTGIPCTFIVDHTGKIGYIGHPMSMDATLDAIVKKAPEPKAKEEKKDKAEEKSKSKSKDDSGTSDDSEKKKSSGSAG